MRKERIMTFIYNGDTHMVCGTEHTATLWVFKDKEKISLKVGTLKDIMLYLIDNAETMNDVSRSVTSIFNILTSREHNCLLHQSATGS